MHALMLQKSIISSTFWKLTKEIKNFRKSPIFKNLIFKNPYIDQLNNITSIKHVIITQSINKTCQFHSILPNFTKSPISQELRTLILKFLINHKNFEIKACESCLYDSWTKTHGSDLIRNPINIKTPKFSKMRKSLKKSMKNAWNVIWWKRKGKSVLP